VVLKHCNFEGSIDVHLYYKKSAFEESKFRTTTKEDFTVVDKNEEFSACTYFPYPRLHHRHLSLTPRPMGWVRAKLL
jgi:hypothetical protein